MTLKNKLTVYYSFTFSVFLCVILISIYLLSEQYRQEEFYQRLQKKIINTFTLLLEVNEIDHDLLQYMDIKNFNNLYDKKIELYDSSGKMIYQSIDSMQIIISPDILKRLQQGEKEIYLAEKNHELFGMEFTSNNARYFGIIKAYDTYGKSKLKFLRWMLSLIFICSIALLALLSRFLSGKITKPIVTLAGEIEAISPQNLSVRVYCPATKDEVGFLAEKFNEMLGKVEDAFSFQSHFIHNLSHELKTPLAVLISNIENAEKEQEIEKWKESLQFQKTGLMEIANILKSLLDISKAETSSSGVKFELLRVDEILFECMDELNLLYDKTLFDFHIDKEIQDEKDIQLKGNAGMMKMALMNLLKNSIMYAENYLAIVSLKKSDTGITIIIENDGPVLNAGEQSFLFTQYYRGSNSRNKKGFGLGLVLANKIILIHSGKLGYSVTPDNKNSFSLFLPSVS